MPTRVQLALCVAFVASSAHAAPAHPPDPFAEQYVVLDEREVGTTAGQLRFIASPVIGRASQGTSLGGQLTIELMTFAMIGIRSSLQTDIVHSASDPGLHAARSGPSLHLLPYRRFDLSLFVEGGIVRVDPPMGGGYFEPMLSPGFGVELWLTSSWFVGIEGHLDWLSLATPGAAQDYLRASATAGVGLGF